MTRLRRIGVNPDNRAGRDVTRQVAGDRTGPQPQSSSDAPRSSSGSKKPACRCADLRASASVVLPFHFCYLVCW